MRKKKTLLPSYRIFAMAAYCGLLIFASNTGFAQWPLGKSKGQPGPDKGIYTQEQDSPYRQAMGKIKDHIDKDRAENFQNMILWKHICKMEEDIRRAAQMMAEMNRLRALMSLVQRGGDAKSSFNYYETEMKMYEEPERLDPKNPDPNNPLSRILLSSEYLSVQESKIITPDLIVKAPVWMPPKDTVSHVSRSRIWLVSKKAAQKASNSDIRALENIIQSTAQIFLPEKSLENFSSKQMAAWLLSKAGVRRLGDGIIARPSAPQDATFRKYSNLGRTMNHSTLFWSDTIVLDGYDPILGTTLNRTPLKGYKTVDMDNATSRGYSGLIDRWNREQPESQRTENPFKGYASKIMPGLLTMCKQGRLTPGEPPDDEQIKEAMQLTRKLALLPSQNMKSLKKAPSKFKFNYPVRAILVDGESESEDDARAQTLPDFEEETYKRSMLMARDRFNEIRRLMEANRLGRQYVNEIIKAYIAWEEESITVTAKIQFLQDSWSPNGWSPSGAIPEIAQLRRDILTSLEHHRTLLSKLENQYDDLRQKEWIILSHIMETRRKAILYLMDKASFHDRLEVNEEEIELEEG